MMTLTRRNVLVGIALVAVVSGVALGSGAFTQVEATRNVDLEMNGDSDALIEFTNGSGAAGIMGSDSDAQDMIEITQDQLNDDATTRFENALNVTNNGPDPVNLEVSGTLGALDIEHDGSSIATSGVEIDANGAETVELDIVINTTESNTMPDSVTFNATSV